jgi:hypothetical protein
VQGDRVADRFNSDIRGTVRRAYWHKDQPAALVAWDDGGLVDVWQHTLLLEDWRTIDPLKAAEAGGWEEA